MCASCFGVSAPAARACCALHDWRWRAPHAFERPLGPQRPTNVYFVCEDRMRRDVPTHLLSLKRGTPRCKGPGAPPNRAHALRRAVSVPEKALFLRPLSLRILNHLHPTASPHLTYIGPHPVEFVQHLTEIVRILAKVGQHRPKSVKNAIPAESVEVDQHLLEHTC